MTIISTLELAKNTARDAGGLILSMVGKSRIYQKGASNNLVTEADTASERLIASTIKKHFPDTEILGEEEHKADLNAPSLWIVDPIDGTNNFAHGIPQFSVSIAYAEYGVVQCGAVYDPSMDELFYAQRGGGAFLNDQPVKVSDVATFDNSIIGTGFYYDRGALLDNTIKAIHILFGHNIQCVRRMGSAALDLCYVASGRFDAYYEYMLSPWDFAAATLILEEAGGVWSDREGQKNGLHSKGMISSNHNLADAFCNVVKYSTINAIKIGL